MVLEDIVLDHPRFGLGAVDTVSPVEEDRDGFGSDHPRSELRMVSVVVVEEEEEEDKELDRKAYVEVDRPRFVQQVSRNEAVPDCKEEELRQALSLEAHKYRGMVPTHKAHLSSAGCREGPTRTLCKLAPGEGIRQGTASSRKIVPFHRATSTSTRRKRSVVEILQILDILHSPGRISPLGPRCHPE